MMRVSGLLTARVAAFLVIASACGKAEETPAIDSAAISLSPAPAPASTPAASSSPDNCPATGQWALCSLEKRLKRSGFVVTRLENESPQRPGFSVKPAVYKLGKGRLEVFLYEDAAMLAKDLAAMDTLAVVPRGGASTWTSQPALIRSGNLAAVYMDQNARQAERLVLAITAGAPSGG
jgi:hypothetical protein